MVGALGRRPGAATLRRRGVSDAGFSWRCTRCAGSARGPFSSPYAKTIGATALVTFLSGFIGLLPWSVRWKGVIPSEGLLGRIVADALIHYFNLVGAYLICVAVIAVALYLSTAFSFGAVRIWSQTRFGFVYAALDRFADWRMERARKRAAKELEKKRAAAAKPSRS